MATITQELSPGEVREEPRINPDDEEWHENLNIRLICPDCREDPPNLTEEMSQGDIVCLSCGLVVGDRLVDNRSEWRTFANDESGGDDPSRVGKAANPLDAGNQLETSISFGDGGNRSRELNRAHAKMNQDKSRKALNEAFARIQQICNQLNVPDAVSDYAKHLYKLTHNERTLKGKNPEAINAGCVLIACRQMAMARTFVEINAVTRVSKTEVGRTFKVLSGLLRNRKNSKVGGGVITTGLSNAVGDGYQDKQATSAEDLCGRYGSQLIMSQMAINCSQDLASKLRAMGYLAGRSPLSVAAACIYMASHLMGDPRTPKQIGNVASVSDGTIRTAYKHMIPEKDQIIDSKWLGEGAGNLDNLPAT